MTGVILTPFTSIKFIWTAPNVFETSAQVGSSDSLKKKNGTSLALKLFHL